jgi:predicted aldo/keto reductase-like oxidoreductase
MLRVVADSGIYEVALTAYNYRQPHREEMGKAINYAAGKGIGVIGMKVLAGFYLDRERSREVNVTAALKWALLNENVCTLIPGFSTFDAMETDLSVMENLSLTPEEKADIKKTQLASIPGLYCQQCGACLAQCRHDLDIPTMMRSYMYAHGYRRPAKAKHALRYTDLNHVPCETCGDCGIQCAMGFDVKEKMLDIARVKNVPDDFLV